MRDILKRVKGEGRAHLWNVRTKLGGSASELTTAAFYKDGDVPTFSDPEYSQKTAAYKYLGIAANITGPMIASGQSFTDIEAEVAEAKLRQVIQAEEWALFNGDSSVTGNLQFDGLAKQITTNVTALSGADIALSDIWKAIKQVRLQGGQSTHVFCSYGVQNQLNTLLLGDLRYIAQQGTVVTMGLHANNIQTPAGVLPLVGDFFINPATPYPYNQTAGTPLTTVDLDQYGSTTTVVATKASHGLLTGQTVSVTSSTQPLYNGTYAVTVLTSGTFLLVGSAYLTHVTNGVVTSLENMGAEGDDSSNVYVLNIPEIEVVDLLPIGRTELAKIADTVRFYINEYSVLAVKAEPWQAMITGVNDPNT